MKKTFLIAALLSCSIFATAQVAGDYTIHGVVQDSLSQQKEPYATVRLFRKGEGKPLVVATTDARGKFTLHYTKPGTYILQTAIIGKLPTKKELVLDADKVVELGTILTQDAGKSLATAEVVAARPLVKSQIDRLVYSMSDDPDAQTNTMLEMLRKVPLVTVDGQDKITVNGKANFKVYVNGKPNKMMSDNPSVVLKSFPASVVKKVEVITDPGAKYDAEGTSGILNIVTATEATTTGYTVTPTLYWSNRGWGGNFFGMAQIGKLTLSAHGGVNGENSLRNTTESERELILDPVNHLLKTKGESYNHGTSGFGGLDASYDISKHDLLSVSSSIYAGRQKGHGLSSTFLTGNAGTVYSYDNVNHRDSRYHGINTSVDYQHQFGKENQNLTVSYRFSSDLRNNKTLNVYDNLQSVPFALKDRCIDPDNKSQEHTAQIDFTSPLGENHTLSVGAKYIYRLNRSDNEEYSRLAGTATDFLPDVAQSLLYRHRTDISAGYTEYIYRLKRFSLRSGLRFESSHIRVTYPNGTRAAFSTRLNDWVPSLNLGYNLTDTQLLRLGYNLRIGRPDIYYLSPYVNHLSPEKISYGNPNLESETAHNFQLNYSLFSQKFSVNFSATYSTSYNGLTFYSFMKDGVEHSTSGNFLHSKQWSFDTYLNVNPWKSTAFTLNGNLKYSDLKSYRTSDHNYGFSGNFFAMLRQDLPWKLKFALGAGATWGDISLQGQGSEFKYYFLDLSRSFLEEDRLTVTLNGFNIFNPRQTLKNTTQTTMFRSSESYVIHGLSRISLGISWHFGKLRAVVKKTARSIENSDVKTGSSSQESGSNMGKSSGN
nr:TonB-dependent receptor [uncultured Alloprevotella sp.]